MRPASCPASRRVGVGVQIDLGELHVGCAGAQHRQAASGSAARIARASASIGAAVPPGVRQLDHPVDRRRLVAVGDSPSCDQLLAQGRRPGRRARGRCRPAPRRPRPRTAGPGRRPAPAGRSAVPPRAAGPSGSATPSTSRRRPRRRAAAGCWRRAGTGSGWPGSQPSSRCRVDALRSPSRSWSSAGSSRRGARAPPPPAGRRPCRSARPARSAAAGRAGRVSSASTRATVVVLPVPGPPASTRDPAERADRRGQPLPVHLAGAEPFAGTAGQGTPAAGRGRRPAGRRGEALLQLPADLLLLLPVALQVEQPVGQPQRAAARLVGPVGDQRGWPRTAPSQSAGSGQGSSARSIARLGLVEGRSVDTVPQIDADRPDAQRPDGQGQGEHAPARPVRRRSGRRSRRCARRRRSSTPAALNVGQQPGRRRTPCSTSLPAIARRPCSRRAPRPAGRTARRPAPPAAAS